MVHQCTITGCLIHPLLAWLISISLLLKYHWSKKHNILLCREFDVTRQETNTDFNSWATSLVQNTLFIIKRWHVLASSSNKGLMILLALIKLPLHGLTSLFKSCRHSFAMLQEQSLMSTFIFPVSLHSRASPKHPWILPLVTFACPNVSLMCLLSHHFSNLSLTLGWR